MEPISLPEARRLALARAGFLGSKWCGLPVRAAGAGRRAREAAHQVIRRFGYLQLDTVSVAGARSHALVLLSRLEGVAPTLGEELLKPGEPLFEYWGHEASWIPLELYPAFGFRRQEFKVHPWWGDLLGEHKTEADRLLARIRDEGPLRSLDLEGEGSKGWWDLKLTKKIATAFWSSGELAISERRNFQRSFDLAERVIPEEVRRVSLTHHESLKVLLLQALAGHGWATTGTLASTWRLRNRPQEIAAALAELVEEGKISPCDLRPPAERTVKGWIRPEDRELAAQLTSLRPRGEQGILLSPFDPLLWDRKRVELLFGFSQVLEIFKRAEHRQYGYYCLPVLAGEQLVARYDLKADWKAGVLRVLAFHPEVEAGAKGHAAAAVALERYTSALGLEAR